MHPPGNDVSSSSTPLLTTSVLSSLSGIARPAFHCALEYPQIRDPTAEGNKSSGEREEVWDQVRPEAHSRSSTRLFSSQRGAPCPAPNTPGWGCPAVLKAAPGGVGWGQCRASRRTSCGCRMRPQRHRVLRQIFLMCFQPAASDPGAASCQKPAFGQPRQAQTHNQKRNTRDEPSAGSDTSGGHRRGARSGASPPWWWTANNSHKDKLQEAVSPFETPDCEESPPNHHIITIELRGEPAPEAPL